jgi:hypothetical protein
LQHAIKKVQEKRRDINKKKIPAVIVCLKHPRECVTHWVGNLEKGPIYVQHHPLYGAPTNHRLLFAQFNTNIRKINNIFIHVNNVYVDYDALFELID